MKEGRKPEYPEKPPGDELQKYDLHILSDYGSTLNPRTVISVVALSTQPTKEQAVAEPCRWVPKGYGK